MEIVQNQTQSSKHFLIISKIIFINEKYTFLLVMKTYLSGTFNISINTISSDFSKRKWLVLYMMIRHKYRHVYNQNNLKLNIKLAYPEFEVTWVRMTFWPSLWPGRLPTSTSSIKCKPWLLVTSDCDSGFWNSTLMSPSYSGADKTRL